MASSLTHLFSAAHQQTQHPSASASVNHHHHQRNNAPFGGSALHFQSPSLAGGCPPPPPILHFPTMAHSSGGVVSADQQQSHHNLLLSSPSSAMLSPFAGLTLGHLLANGALHHHSHGHRPPLATHLALMDRMMVQPAAAAGEQQHSKQARAVSGPLADSASTTTNGAECSPPQMSMTSFSCSTDSDGRSCSSSSCPGAVGPPPPPAGVGSQQLPSDQPAPQHNHQNGTMPQSGQKPKKQLVRDEAYWERRRKNNDAAKRSRDSRRKKEDEVAVRAVILEQENLRLRFEVERLRTEIERHRIVAFSGTLLGAGKSVPTTTGNANSDDGTSMAQLAAAMAMANAAASTSA